MRKKDDEFQNFPLLPIVQKNFKIERDEDRQSPVNRERNKERAERKEKKLGEHERNTRQRVREKVNVIAVIFGR